MLRSMTDEIMYELMLLSNQEYVDVYAAKAKADIAAARKAGQPEPMSLSRRRLGRVALPRPGADARGCLSRQSEWPVPASLWSVTSPSTCEADAAASGSRRRPRFARRRRRSPIPTARDPAGRARGGRIGDGEAAFGLVADLAVERTAFSAAASAFAARPAPRRSGAQRSQSGLDPPGLVA